MSKEEHHSLKEFHEKLWKVDRRYNFGTLAFCAEWPNNSATAIQQFKWMESRLRPILSTIFEHRHRSGGTRQRLSSQIVEFLQNFIRHAAIYINTE